MGTGIVKTLRKLKLVKPLPEAPSIFTADDPNYSNFEIGDYTYGKPTVECHWEGLATLKIGKYCSIAGDVTIYLGGEHHTDWISTYPFNKIFSEANHIEGHPWSRGDVIIGNDVWIGTGAFIRSGVTIGSGAVIGAKSVVTKNINPYEIVVGNPAKPIKKRFSDEVISDLLSIEWWNWPHEKITEEIPGLLHDDVAAFIRKHKKTK